MNMVVRLSWRILGSCFLLFALPNLGVTGEVTLVDPHYGEQITAARGGGVSEAKLAKQEENLAGAAQDFAAARFERAAQWYEAALQLEPEREDIKSALQTARQLAKEQEDYLAQLPQGADERKQFLQTAFEQAQASLDQGQFDKAQAAFHKIWVTVGDYEGKTLSQFTTSGQKLAEQVARAAQEAQAAVEEVVAEPVQDVQAEVAQAAEGAVDDVTRIQANKLVRDAQKLKDQGELNKAQDKVAKALELWPDHPEATVLAAELASALEDGSAPSASAPVEFAATPRATEQGRASLEKQHELDGLHTQAVTAYEAGDLAKARGLWERMLSEDPSNKIAQTWLEETQDAFERAQANLVQRQEAQARQEAAEKLLNAPISISTDRKIALSEFMYSLSFATPNELEYYIAEGAEAMVFANFVDMPLREVLDTVLLPIGLSWTINEKNVITVAPKLISRTYNLSPDQMSKVRAMLDKKIMQRNVWGQTEPPAKGVEIVLDERQNLLMVTGSELHIQKVESFLPSMQEAQAPDLVVKIYKIREEDGPKIKSLINSLISASAETPFDIERKIFVDGDDLIVRDTPDNIIRIEELLLNKDFIQNIHDETLDLQNFSLVPREVENIKSDQIRVFTSRVVEAIKVFLYAQEGERKAGEQGRRLWFDEATLQLTVVDTPTNLASVGEYIDSLPELRQRSLQKVRFLKYAVAEDLSSSLERILELTGAGTAGGSGGGQEVVVKLRRGDERQFRDIRIRAVRFDEGDEEDRNDDTVEVTISIPGTGPQSLTLRELDPQDTDEYEFLAEDVVPSSGLAGEGSARIRIRYVPQFEGGRGPQQAAEEETPAKSTATEEGITITPFGELNALILRYTNPALYQDAIDLIEQLDQPTKQVEIETKFVEVNETRAKEFSSDFNIAGLGSGRDLDWANSTLNSRFAQDLDEFRDIFSPPIENPASSNLIKGTTVLGFTTPGYPNLQFSLRLLEAEGILNIVNGPRVLALDGNEAEFRIEQYTSTDDSDVDTADEIGQIANTFSGVEDLELSDQDEVENDGLITAVVLRMTPEITSENSILLTDLSAELIDFEGWLGTPLLNGLNPDIDEDETVTYDFGLAMANYGEMLLKRKKVVTDARISNGGTIVIGGWTGERSQELTSGVPVLRNLPYVGKLLFSRAQRTRDRTTLLIFLTGSLVD